MKKFVVHILSLGALLLGLLIVCDIAYTQIYTKSNPRSKLQYILNTKKESYDAVFLGSSRVANHIDPKLFDSLSGKKTINLGVLGAGLNDNLLELKLLLYNENSVNTVYLQVDDNYEYTHPTTMATAGAMPFVRHDIIEDHLEDYIEDFDKLKQLPFYRYAINDHKIGLREAFFSVINKKPRIDPSTGYTPKFGNMLSQVGVLPDTLALENKIFNDLLSVCKENKIKLILFTAPYSSKMKNIEYIDKLKAKFPELIDFSRGYTDELFFNYGHLNHQGAQKFTEDLYLRTKSSL